MKILLVAGARPNFMKIAPLIHELQNHNDITWKLIHTGQHYDYSMSKVFFENFDLPEPHYFLDVGSASHAQQTAKIMVEFEKVCQNEAPDLVAVAGDVNSTIACSITAKKLHIKVAHIEAGLRSGDMEMPEEINRIVTDSISDYLFVTEKSGVENLQKEGKSPQQIHFVGNLMIDTLYYCLKKVDSNPSQNPYAVVTLHRPSNVDDKQKLKEIMSALEVIAEDFPIHFPMHPRTKKNMEQFGISVQNSNIHITPPLSYLDFLALWKNARLVLTDSGGLQEETTALQIPCFTIRENTERPITIEMGSNTLVGTTKQQILQAYQDFCEKGGKQGAIPEFWDGKAAQRIIGILKHGTH